MITITAAPTLSVFLLDYLVFGVAATSRNLLRTVVSPSSPRLLRRQTGVVTCSHWATLTNSHIWRLSSSFCPLHGSRTGPAAHQEFCVSLPLGGGIATVALSLLLNAIREAAPSLTLVECFLFQATDLRCPAALLEQPTHGATHPESLQMVPISLLVFADFRLHGKQKRIDNSMQYSSSAQEQ